MFSFIQFISPCFYKILGSQNSVHINPVFLILIKSKSFIVRILLLQDSSCLNSKSSNKQKKDWNTVKEVLTQF